MKLLVILVGQLDLLVTVIITTCLLKVFGLDITPVYKPFL